MNRLKQKMGAISPFNSNSTSSNVKLREKTKQQHQQALLPQPHPISSSNSKSFLPPSELFSSLSLDSLLLENQQVIVNKRSTQQAARLGHDNADETATISLADPQPKSGKSNNNKKLETVSTSTPLPAGSGTSLSQQILRLSSSAVLGVGMATGVSNTRAFGPRTAGNLGPGVGTSIDYDPSQNRDSSATGSEDSTIYNGDGSADMYSDSISASSAAQSFIEQMSSLFSLQTFQNFDGNYEKLVIPLAGITLLTAFLLVLIVNYFLHMRRNGFFKRGGSGRANRINESGSKNRLDDKSSGESSKGEDKEKLVRPSSGKCGEETTDVTSNLDLVLESQFDLPPLPSPQLEYRPFPGQMAYNQIGPYQDHTPSPPLPHRQVIDGSASSQNISSYAQPKMAGIVAAAQHQHQHLHHHHHHNHNRSGGNSPQSANPPTAPNIVHSNSGGLVMSVSPKPQTRGTGILSGHRPSMSSIRSNPKGSSERILSVQESFDSAYEVRLYDELTIDPSNIVTRALSKRAPLLKGESFSDADYSASGTPVGSLGAKKLVPQSLSIANDAAANGSSPSYFTRQPSMGGDLSPVEELPGHEAHSTSTSSPAHLPYHGQAANSQHTSQSSSVSAVQPEKPSKIRFEESVADNVKGSATATASSPSKLTPTTPTKQKSLLSIFKEKRVTLMEHVKAMSPTKGEQNLPNAQAPLLPPKTSDHHGYMNHSPDINAQNQASAAAAANRLRQQHDARHSHTGQGQYHGHHSGSGVNLSSAQMSAMGSSVAQSQSMTKMALGGGERTSVGPSRGGMAGRGRGGRQSATGGGTSQVNANMLMGRMGRGGDS